MKPAGDFHVSFKKFETPAKEPLKSWWADESVQLSRQEFQRRLVDEELDRISGNQRFGGVKLTHDKFPGSPKKR